MTETISIFGLGLMGRPMARTLQNAGYTVRGWNRSLLSANLTQGISVCHTLADAANAEICLLILSDSAAVDAVLEQMEPYLTAGQLVLDMGSSDPEHSKVHAERLAAKGIGWVDAPVSGGPEGAKSGSLAIMAGGSSADFERVKPILDVLGGNVVHVGGPGMGHTVKVINQVIVGLALEAVTEALTLAKKLSINPQLVQQALKGGFADSKVLQLHGTRMINRDFAPGGKVKTQHRDLKLAQKLAASVGITLPHLESAINLYQQLMDQGDEELDHSAVFKLLWP